MSNNYYEILKLDKNCSKDDIKKQYKKFALLYHPDKNTDEDSSEKFQKINEAYNTLYDDVKRSNYDLYGTKDEFEDPFETFNNIFNDHLSNFMNMGMKYEKEINLNHIINNLTGMKAFNVPDVHFKFQTYQKNNNEKIEVENKLNIKPNTIYKDICVTLEEIYCKKEKEIIINRTRLKNNKYVKKDKKIKIFIYDDEILLENVGDEKENYSLKGDIVINIEMKEDKKFKRINEYDLLYFKEIKLKDFYNNIDYEIVLPNKKKIKIRNEKFNNDGNNTQKILNYGIPYKKDNKWVSGNLYIYYKIKFPLKDELYDFVEEVYDEEKELDFDSNLIISKNSSLNEIII